MKEKERKETKEFSESRQKEKWLRNTFVVCFLAMICCVLWGSAFSCIKLGYEWWQIPSKETGTQIIFAGIRFTLAGIMVTIMGSILQKRVLVPKKKEIGIVVKLSLIQTILQYFFFYIGLANTTGVKASIITGTNVFIAIIIAVVVFHQETMNRNKIIGCLLGFVGVILVNYNGSGLEGSFQLTGEGAIFLSALSYGISSCLIKRYSVEHDTVMLSGWQFTLGGIVLTVGGFLMGGKLAHSTGKGMAILIYLALVSAVAYTLWGILLKYNPVSKVAVFGFMNPVVGVFLSAVILQEKKGIGLASFVALVCVSAGIYIVNKKKDEKIRVDRI